MKTHSHQSIRIHRLAAVLSLLGAGILAMSTGGCASNKPSLAMFEDYLVGSYSSANQAEEDEAYHDIRLQIVPIWKKRADGPWLYVEQATAAALDQPYRQRVYRLARVDDKTFRSDVYELPAPALKYAGAYKESDPLADLSPDDLTLKDGCSVFMTYHQCSKFFDGGTRGANCLSSLRGAAYATSEVSLWNELLISWDRGFDAEGKQVWGAEKGGYRFLKLTQAEN